MPGSSCQLGGSAGRNWGPVLSQLFCGPQRLPLSLEHPRVRHTAIHGVCAVLWTDMILVPEEGEATSQLSHRQA